MLRLSVWILAAMFFFGRPGVSSAEKAEDVPRFEDYPVQMYTGPAAAPDDPDLDESDTERLVSLFAEGPVVAGEYVMLGGSCGSGGCYYTQLYSKRTGKWLTSFSAYTAYESEMRVGEELMEFKENSRLLITGGVPEKEEAKGIYYTNYYIVEDDDLKLIKTVKTPWRK